MYFENDVCKIFENLHENTLFLVPMFKTNSIKFCEAFKNSIFQNTSGQMLRIFPSELIENRFFLFVKMFLRLPNVMNVKSYANGKLGNFYQISQDFLI